MAAESALRKAASQPGAPCYTWRDGAIRPHVLRRTRDDGAPDEWWVDEAMRAVWCFGAVMYFRCALVLTVMYRHHAVF